MLKNNTVDILIPVYNCELFIYFCLASAIKTADLINANLIVALNKCSDSTPDIVSQFDHPRLTVIQSNVFLEATENFNNALRESTSQYIILCGADDILNPVGQAAIAKYFIEVETKPDILYGYDVIIDTNNAIKRSHHLYYGSSLCDDDHIIRACHARNPNQNGSWISRHLYDSIWLHFDYSNNPSLSRVSDHFFWYLCIANLLNKGKLLYYFCYCHAPAIYYREYFNESSIYRNPEYPLLAAEGRINFNLYTIRHYKLNFDVSHHSAAIKGIGIYIANNIHVITKHFFGTKIYNDWLNVIINRPELPFRFRFLSILLSHKYTAYFTKFLISCFSFSKSKCGQLKNAFFSFHAPSIR